MAKSIDIQRKLKEQLDALDELTGLNINIDALLKSIKSETTKFINKNQKNIVKLLEVEKQLSKLLNQHRSAIGTLEENIVNVFNVLSDLNKFGRTIERINRKISKTNEILSEVNLDPLKEFDTNIIIDFFGELNRKFSVSKMNRISKYINNISLDGLSIVTDDLKKFDVSIITSFLGTINRLFGENKLNRIINKITKTSGTEDFELVIMYLKDMDKFLIDSIKYLNKMTDRIKKFVNKTELKAGGTPEKIGAEGTSEKGMFGKLLFAGAGIGLLNQQFPKLTRMVGMIAVIGKAFVDVGSKVFGGMSQMVRGIKSVTQVGLGLTKMLGGLALGFALVVGIVIMGIKKLLEGVEEAQKMRLEAAKGAGLNELAFMRSSAAGQVTPGGILSRFAGAGEEQMIGARAQMLARMGGMQQLGGMTNIQSRNMAMLSQFFGIGLGKLAQMRDIMQNIEGIAFEEKSLEIINKYGILANRIVKDISENTKEYVLYGAESFERLSGLANRLSINTKDAIKLIEKFSTVSSAIDTSFDIALATGNFVNPLGQFMQYAFGDPDEIFKDVIESVGDVSSMNRIQQKFLADALGMSADELIIATNRFEKIEKMGRDEYEKQYSTLDEIVKSYGFQRLLGGISQILDMLEKEVFRGFFQRALEWIRTEGENIPRVINEIARVIREDILPAIVKVFVTIAQGILSILGSPIIPSGISGADADNLISQLDRFQSAVIGGFGGEERTGRHERMVTSPRTNLPTMSPGNIIEATTPVGTMPLSGISPETISEREVKVINVKSDINLDGHKVGEGLTEVALEFPQ